VDATVSNGETTRRAIPFSEFRQIVRRHRPSELLPVIASLATAVEGPPYDMDVIRFMQPWGLATIARESVLHGNEHRKPGISQDDVTTLMNAHNNIYEEASRPEDHSALSIITRVAYEQFPYQESVFEEISRTHALLIDGLPHIEAEVLTEETWTHVLGAPLPKVVGSTFLLHVAAERNAGWFDPAWLDGDAFEEVLKAWPREVVLDRVGRLSSTFDEFRAAYENVQKPPRGWERYAFNPLTSRPFLRWPDGRYLAPQPRLILRTVSPGNLYYDGIRTLGGAFARDLGKLVERYVGEQLKTVGGAELYPEIRYGKQNQMSTDWFLVLPTLVIMFEVKSARFGLLDRAADPGFEDRISKVLIKAVTQLDRSARAIDHGLPEFDRIPVDRPKIGIIVTAEPYYLANSPMVRELLPHSETPILTASLRDLEHLVCLPSATVAEQLLSIVEDPERSTWMLRSALKGIEAERRNAILDAAWAAYPWPDGTEPEEPSG